jgi:hypothetical protein
MNKKILFAGYILAVLLSGCGSSPEQNITIEQKKAKNPNIEIYNENCQQGEKSNLCGYEPNLSKDPSTSMPQLPCGDEVYCL